MTARTTATAAWRDAAGGAYGPVTLPLDTVVDLPPELVATLIDALDVDADGNGLPTPGDTIRYAAEIRNNGSLPLIDVALEIPGGPSFELGELAAFSSVTVDWTVVHVSGRVALGLVGRAGRDCRS